MTKATAFTLGLTGGIGSGKTTVANLFAELGASLVDTDLIAHQLSSPGGIAIPEISRQFGPEFILPDGAMDRRKMREHVFAHPAEKARLEAILHPLIRSETEKAASSASGSYIIFVVPLLVESGSWKTRVSRVLVVDCSEQTQIQRVMSRNGLTEQQVRAIMNTQVSREKRLQAADDIITNEGDIAQIAGQVRHLHAKYVKLAESAKTNLRQRL
ncbi:dephospho-CoA kinase [Undibacterium sp.]|jgi:dephospho-CoA kinase|uniref:dephospho-CoA kinase n=1 Tax=Undibacterium sp. TaxID=1914977 RepID=UPI002C84CAF2|nr:dephospho-CoA kinase [Undibacterium sp.]HTD02401.1 dephospho-CoA kinase [Undibacterium sp.]